MGDGLPRAKCHWSLNVEAWDAVLSWPSHHKYPCLLLPLSLPTTNPHVLWSGEIGPRPSTFLDCDTLPRWHRRRACNINVQPHGVRGARQWLLLIFIGHTSRLWYMFTAITFALHIGLPHTSHKWGHHKNHPWPLRQRFLRFAFAAMAFLQRSADSTQVAAQAPNYLPTRPLLCCVLTLCRELGCLAQSVTGL